MAHRGTYNTRVSVRHSIRADAGNKSFNKLLKFIFDPIKGLLSTHIYKRSFTYRLYKMEAWGFPP